MHEPKRLPSGPASALHWCEDAASFPPTASTSGSATARVDGLCGSGWHQKSPLRSRVSGTHAELAG